MPVIQCPCGKKLKVRDELAGKKVKCPGCGNAVAAPAPPAREPLDELEVVEETAVKAPAPPTPVWNSKKKPVPARENEDETDEEEEDKDDEDENETPYSYWLFPGTLSTEIMVVAQDGIWFASLGEKTLKSVKKLLATGTHPGQVLGPKASRILWQSIQSIYSNKKLRGFTIYHNNGEAAVKSLTPADCEMRDEIFEVMSAFLAPEWTLTTKHHTAVTATLWPLGSIAATVVITGVLALFSQWSVDAINARFAAGEQVVRVHWAEDLLYKLGPIWTGVVGLVIAMVLTIWLMARILVPPIDMHIRRAPKKSRLDDDD